MWQRGTNSDWLLPNRISEASWCGCFSVALDSIHTGKRIREAGIGRTIHRIGTAVSGPSGG